MEKFQIRQVKAGVKFDLKAANGQTVLTSEVYTAPDACRKGMDSVRKVAPTAPVEEGLQEDAELYAQIKASDEGKAALQILQKLYGMATRGDTYLMAGEKEPLVRQYEISNYRMQNPKK